ncbi:MAG: hypothetical protein AAGF11_11545 [Myxococcota bacterium]
MPRRPRRDRDAEAIAALPDDDRFAAHPDQSIDVVYVMGRAAHLVGARLREVVAVMLASLVLAGVLVLGVTASGAMGEDRSWTMLLTVLLAWSFGLLLQTPLVGAAIEVHTERRGLALEFLRRGLARFGHLLVASLAVLFIVAVVSTLAACLQLGLAWVVGSLPLNFVGIIIVFVGSVALLVAALRIITAFGLVVPIILVEGLEPALALRRSWEIGWRNSTSIFLALLLPTLLAQFVLFLAGYMPAFITIPVAIVLGVGLVLYNSAVIPAAYVVIREYVEGLDPAQLLSGRRGRR